MICVENDTAKRTFWWFPSTATASGPIWTITGSRIAAARASRRLQITEKTGKLIAIKAVTDENDLMIINRSGLTIRIPVGDIRLAGRATQGVKVINLRGGDSIASVIEVPKSGRARVGNARSGRRKCRCPGRTNVRNRKYERIIP